MQTYSTRLGGGCCSNPRQLAGPSLPAIANGTGNTVLNPWIASDQTALECQDAFLQQQCAASSWSLPASRRRATNQRAQLEAQLRLFLVVRKRPKRRNTELVGPLFLQRSSLRVARPPFFNFVVVLGRLLIFKSISLVSDVLRCCLLKRAKQFIE